MSRQPPLPPNGRDDEFAAYIVALEHYYATLDAVDPSHVNVEDPEPRVESSDATMMSCDLVAMGPTSQVIKNLQCPVCQGFPIPPLWNCVSGHITCDQCKTQLRQCGLCRKPFTGGRNFFMEEVVNDCTVTCPYSEGGCKAQFKASFMKAHASECKFGPQLKWITCHDGLIPPNAVEGGLERGVKLYVMRARYQGSNSPGKLAEFSFPGVPGETTASLAWGGGERFARTYEVLTAPPDAAKWVPSSGGVIVPNAVIGGNSENAETLYIGRFQHQGHLINGKIHPSHRCAYIGFENREIASSEYEILVQIPRQIDSEKSQGSAKPEPRASSNRPGHSMYS